MYCLVSSCNTDKELSAEPNLGLSVCDGVLCLHGEPYRGIGVNYFSLFYRTLKVRQDKSYEEGLADLSDAGIPFVRFMACGFWPSEWELYFKDRDLYFQHLDAIVVCAEKNNIGLIPSLFWNMATLPDIVGEPMDQLGNSESKSSEFIRTYTAEVVGRYKDSPAIWAWEFGNEYNLHIDLPNAAKHRPPIWPKLKTAASRSERDDVSAEMMLTAFNVFATTVRKFDKQRVLITGNSIQRPHAWHNSHENSWEQDTPEQFGEILLRDNPEPYSVLCVHVYPRENNKYSGGCSTLTRLIDSLQAVSESSGKPLFIGEFGASKLFGPKKEREQFKEIFDAITSAGVPLSALWVFDHSGQSKDWNVTFDNNRAYMLEAVSEANRELNK